MIHKQSGLSLIELMISLTLGIVLMTGVTQMFLSSRVTYSTQQAISRIQESGRMAVDFLARDIRMAGYRGCMTSNSDFTNGLDEDSGDFDFQHEFEKDDIQGFSAESAPSDIDAADDTDVLLVRRASGAGVPIEEGHSAGTNANFKTAVGADGNNCLLNGEFCKDDIGLITDCTKGRAFRAVTISNSSGKATISHSGASGNAKSPGNDSNDLGGQSFGAGSQIMAFNTTVYFVAESGFSPDGDTEIMSLWKKVGENDPVELIEGVEDMEVHYGFYSGSNATGVPDTYWTVSEMETGGGDWAEVKAVRVHLLLQGMEPNVLQEQQTVFFAGNDMTFDDGRMRQVFSTTIGIRGRLN